MRIAGFFGSTRRKMSEMKLDLRNPIFAFWLVLTISGFVLTLTPFYNYNVIPMSLSGGLIVGYACGYSEGRTGA